MSRSEKTITPAVPETGRPKRPFLLTLLCCFAFPFFGLISLLLLVSVFYSGFFTDLINTYIVGKPVKAVGVFSILFLLFILYATALTGTILMYRMKRAGYYLFGIPMLSVCIYQLFQPDIPALSTGILISLLVLFGVFLKKMR
jgi:hypothetical protein